MERVVTVIAPKIKPKFLEDGTALLPTQKRAVAYCRVSTLNDEQKTSYDNQIDEWTKRIKNDPKLIFVDIYADHGLSGARAENRVALNKMIADAKAGKFDIIYTKSVSRMARNTIDSLNIAKELKDYGVEIFFDEEHISSIDPKNDVMFTLSSVMAQEESRHTSENIKWTNQKKMEEGCVFLTDTKFLGYRKDPNNPKNLIVVPEEAAIVKEIFELYVSGVGTNGICRRLEEEGHLTGAKKTKWYASTVESIIRNEKYCGDLLLQKSVTLDFLTHKRVKNEGHAKQYFVENNHEPIIDKDTWNKAQLIYQKNAARFRGEDQSTRKYTSRYPLSGMVMCIHCGDSYKRRHWIQGYPEPRIVYQCTNYIDAKQKKRCPSKAISEDILNKAVCDAINEMFLSKNASFKELYKLIERHIHIEDVEEDINKCLDIQARIEDEINVILAQKGKATSDIEHFMLDKQYKERINEYKDLEAKIHELQVKEQNAKLAIVRLEEMKKVLAMDIITPDLLTKEIVEAFIKKIIVVDKTTVVMVIDSTGEIEHKAIKEMRKEIANQEPILTKEILLERHYRPERLTYKVVMI